MIDPAPTPPPLPPASADHPPGWLDPRALDAKHLRLLWIFHYVYAGMGILGIGFLALHYHLMSSVFANPKMWQQAQNPPPFDPRLFFAAFKWFYVLGGALVLIGMVLNAISGWCLAHRKARVYSLIVAGLNCLRFPFGMALGIFSLIVLVRDSVRGMYEEPTR